VSRSWRGANVAGKKKGMKKQKKKIDRKRESFMMARKSGV
jgi:hypothetical protein